MIHPPIRWAQPHHEAQSDGSVVQPRTGRGSSSGRRLPSPNVEGSIDGNRSRLPHFFASPTDFSKTAQRCMGELAGDSLRHPWDQWPTRDVNERIMSTPYNNRLGTECRTRSPAWRSGTVTSLTLLTIVGSVHTASAQQRTVHQFHRADLPPGIVGRGQLIRETIPALLLPAGGNRNCLAEPKYR